MFVIYHIPSTVQVSVRNGQPFSIGAVTYPTRGAALLLAKRLNVAKHGPDFIGPGVYGVAEEEHYRTRVVRMVTRVNLMSKQEYQEPSNTPNYMSPASEAYWSM